MKRWIGVTAVAMGLLAGMGCSRPDQDRAREEQNKAQGQLNQARDKLRQDLKRADAQTREDLDKARQQLNHALNQSERDADKAREKLRQEREEHQDNGGDNQR